MREPYLFDRRPIIVAVAGPNGAGKTTFHHAHLSAAGLRFVNADGISRELDLDASAAARAADALRRAMVTRRESFVFETVLSDPVGDKVAFLKAAVVSGYTVVLCYIGLASARISEERVAMRVSQGGHDVPSDKIESRFSRTLTNLKAAIRELPHVLVFDNSDLSHPFRFVAEFEDGRQVGHSRFPRWLRLLMR